MDGLLFATSKQACRKMKLLSKLMARFKKEEVARHLSTAQVKEIAKAALCSDEKLPLAVWFEDGKWYVQTMTIGSSRTVVIDDMSEKILVIENKGLR
jgi:hypothetical protein